MANRISQIALEALSSGNPGARVTQVAVEALTRIGSAATLRETQAVLEVVEEAPPAAGVRGTQAALEVVHKVAAFAVYETQAALEHVDYPPNAVWQTQACLEVLFTGFIPPEPGLRNYAYTGGWART